MAASTLISFILRTIDGLASHPQHPSLSSSSDQFPCQEIEKLKTKLGHMQKSVKASEDEIGDASVKLWLAELQHLAYATENTVAVWESYQESQVGSANKRKRVEDGPYVKVPISDCLSQKLEEIERRLDEMETEWTAICLTKNNGRKLINDSTQQLSGFQIDKSFIYGRENDKMMVIQMLQSFDYRKSNVCVIPILGMAGIGKTTLAQLVYNDSMICMHFTAKGWVYISQTSDLSMILKAIIESVTGMPCLFSEMIAVQQILEEVVKGKRLLLVLDDVWNEEERLWECLKSNLKSAEITTILVTTQSEQVAKIMQTIPAYRVSLLSHTDCWSLFSRYAFEGQDMNEHPNLVDIGKKIVMKCRGLPLAARTVGGLLRFETDEERWKNVLETDMLDLIRENM
ncbi:putative disease resistance protein RGA3 [Typha angustifolia]|uniref:putative disease resistance protein RGA3 n=1 Tax=Typha angustifolia TaxID=59011 RepID=UPI003C2BE042